MSTSYITYKFRIKDSISAKHLNKMSESVNIVWNYCNEASYNQIKKHSKWLNNFDLCKLTAGTSKELNLQAHTIQMICKEYTNRRVQFKKHKLKWRIKKSLGWIPFDEEGIKIYNNKNTIVYNKHHFKFWNSRKIKGAICSGSFNQDSRGRWYVNIVCLQSDQKSTKDNSVGLDLGLKTKLTLSDGIKYNRENITKKYEQRLAMAQRANKKKLIKSINAKMKNIRKDWSHKVSTEIARNYNNIIIGNVKSSKLAKTKLAKSIYDASWFQMKTQLEYKAIRLGGTFQEVNENFSTITCSICKERTGPKGKNGLRVREWECSHCKSTLDRDINAANNILRIGLDTLIGSF